MSASGASICSGMCSLLFKHQIMQCGFFGYMWISPLYLVEQWHWQFVIDTIADLSVFIGNK